MNIYVGNISYDTHDDDLRTAFSAYGAVDSAHVITERDTGRSRGFGFVEMPNAEEARAGDRSPQRHRPSRPEYHGQRSPAT